MFKSTSSLDLCIYKVSEFLKFFFHASPKYSTPRLLFTFSLFAACPKIGNLSHSALFDFYFHLYISSARFNVYKFVTPLSDATNLVNSG